MGKFDDDEILVAKAKAIELELCGWEDFMNAPVSTLKKICNGCGAEWMPSWSREILDKRFEDLKIAFMLHDFAYYNGNGTDGDFHSANTALSENGAKIAKDRYAWYDPRRYLVARDANRLARICEIFGRKAYDEAIAERKAIEKNGIAK